MSCTRRVVRGARGTRPPASRLLLYFARMQVMLLGMLSSSSKSISREGKSASTNATTRGSRLALYNTGPHNHSRYPCCSRLLTPSRPGPALGLRLAPQRRRSHPHSPPEPPAGGAPRSRPPSPRAARRRARPRPLPPPCSWARTTTRRSRELATSATTPTTPTATEARHLCWIARKAVERQSGTLGPRVVCLRRSGPRRSQGGPVGRFVGLAVGDLELG